MAAHRRRRRAPIPSPIQLRVVGLTFRPGYPEIAQELQRCIPVKAKLVREPTNKKDPNAIMVLIPGRQLGYLQRAMAKRLAPELDAGIRWRVAVSAIVRHPEHLDQPAIWLEAERATLPEA